MKNIITFSGLLVMLIMCMNFTGWQSAVTRVELIVPAKALTFPINDENLKGKIYVLEEGKIKDFMKDFDQKEKQVTKYKSLAVLKIIMKNGTTKLFYGDGRSFTDVSKKEKIDPFMFYENIITKYWGFDLK